MANGTVAEIFDRISSVSGRHFVIASCISTAQMVSERIHCRRTLVLPDTDTKPSCRHLII